MGVCLVRRMASAVRWWARCRKQRLLRTGQRFVFEGQRYRYFCHPYNVTWGNERTVEVPLARQFLAAAKGRRVLELGNVLAHYGLAGHEVVDKYEVAPGVRNLDLFDIPLEPPYDAILSISTIEHIEVDEEIYRSGAYVGESPGPPAPGSHADTPLRVAQHLVDLLAPGGRLMVTWPLGANAFLDAAAFRGDLAFDTLHYLRRLDDRNRWQIATLDEVRDLRYGTPFPCANAIAVATHQKPAR